MDLPEPEGPTSAVERWSWRESVTDESTGVRGRRGYVKERARKEMGPGSRVRCSEPVCSWDVAGREARRNRRVAVEREELI